MTLSAIRVRAVVRKELRDYRRNRFIAVTMTVMPLIFVALPITDIFTLAASAPADKIDKIVGLTVLYLLLIPAVVPAAVAAYAIVGEREQGTLEPVLTTPVRREEFLLGKALAALVPTIAISYAMYGVFLGAVAAFARPNVASDVFQAPRILTQLLFTPLLAGWSIWVGIAISARSSDVRVAQQIGTLASLPPLAVTSLMGFGVIKPTLALALALGAGLLAIDLLAWRLVATIFDRERLVTGSKASSRRLKLNAVPRAAKPARGNEPATSAVLRLERTMPTNRIDSRRSWQVHLDGEPVGTIARNDVLDLPIDPGRHTLRLTSTGRRGSPLRPFDADDESMTRFTCHPQPLWPLLLMALAVPDRWIVLKQR
ncbi:ABC transporter permease subunit [Actinocrinis puniceicyclus]|uniref:ABC transporter permease subunit n=1 Tax=Actinocrinis puniceicyclus TaxID=977794 RepID=A0A8J8BDB5_9ACTN|nr:ABC transporter permease subunit [Actinocrinis puniceicyclus]MBS2962634.1 ABC transporter permease subunit [Actinocrinis puniceicyclus]